jgi:ParB family chromosome partitioning protein
VSKRRALGRGLDALLGGPGEATLRSLPVASLRPNRLQPRAAFDEEALAELADSIRAQGVIQPLVVTPAADGSFVIVAGERRWRAAQRAGLDEVPVVVRELELADERELLELALIENLQRTDLNPVEEAEGLQALATGFGLAQEAIAQRLGKSRTAVSNSLRLLRLPEEVQELLRSGALTAGQARPLVPLPAGRALDLARRAVALGLSARQLERLATGERGRRRLARPADPDTAAAAERLTRRLQTKVEIRRRGRGGRLLIHFHSEEELIRLFDVLSRGES